MPTTNNVHDIQDVTTIATVEEAQNASAQAVENIRYFSREISSLPLRVYENRMGVNAKRYGKIDDATGELVEKGIEQLKLDRDAAAAQAKLALKEVNPKATVQALTDAGDAAASSIDEKIIGLEGEIADLHAQAERSEGYTKSYRDEIQAMRNIIFWARDFIVAHGGGVATPQAE